MRKGIVVLQPPSATAELQAQVVAILTASRWSCEPRRRFDGVRAVLIERADDRSDATRADVEDHLRQSPLLVGAAFEVRALS
jgi:hypothetical protein